MKSKLIYADKEITEFKHITEGLNQEIAVKVAQVKQYQKQVEAYRKCLGQV